MKKLTSFVLGLFLLGIFFAQSIIVSNYYHHNVISLKLYKK